MSGSARTAVCGVYHNALYDSPYNGLNFCQGCMSEALVNPAEEIFAVVPGISGPEPGKVGFAYAFGYIHAALQAVEEL